jgi:hypothetical protein
VVSRQLRDMLKSWYSRTALVTHKGASADSGKPTIPSVLVSLARTDVQDTTLVGRGMTMDPVFLVGKRSGTNMTVRGTMTNQQQTELISQMTRSRPSTRQSNSLGRIYPS